MKQHEAVERAMREAGGYATLGYLYQTALKVPGVQWGTQTPFASIRRIVQTHPDLFFRIRPGLWGLSAKRKAILATLAIRPDTTAKGPSEFDHTYYQGLLVEIGNLKEFVTAVPNQDKNRIYLHKRLAEVVTAKESFDFTYESIVRRARTIDVVWYNARHFPHTLFEVEHSTDIEHSLIKFLEFQDFKISYRIVADAARKREFQSKLSGSAFAPIRAEVNFWDYESVADLHSKLSASAAAEQKASLR